MKRSISEFAVIPLAVVAFAAALGCASTAWGAPSATLTTLHAIHALNHDGAAKQPHVAFEATVTYRRSDETTLFVQDGDEGIYVWTQATIDVAPGDRVKIEGNAADSYRPFVIAESVSVLHHGNVPAPVPATYDEMVGSAFDSLRVSVRARVHSADLVWTADRPETHAQLFTDGGLVNAYINNTDPETLIGLLDAEVEVTGVSSAFFDTKKQKAGVALAVSSIADLKIIHRAQTVPSALPVTRMDEIIANYHVNNFSRRVRVRGTVTYYQPGSAMVLQSDIQSLWIMTASERPVKVGDEVDVTGFPDLYDGSLALSAGEVLEHQGFAPIAPQPATLAELTSGKHVFDLVSIEGKVVMKVRETSQDEYVLVSNGQIFSAIYRHPNAGGLSPLPFNDVPLGSIVRASGICTLGQFNPLRGNIPFDLLLRTPDDIVVVARPSPLNVFNLTIAIGVLLVVVIFVGARSWAFERKVRRESANTAYIERRRGRILEDINGSRPLAEIIEQITELVSFQLKGAPCWCQVAGGSLLGNSPEKPSALRILHHKIPSRSGSPLGELSAAFDPLTKPSSIEPETLAMAAELATLAIETRRLYSDLLHRSEFDLLTDINNRFSFDKRLDAQIDEARHNAGIFGLIYIDLDGFKQVNDMHGHLVGDLYLQEVATRMKHQLRPGDTLARLGGDEFAALLPMVRSRAEVQDVALRLEHCFADPYTVESIILTGSASVGIALYPEDGAGKDKLLSAADTAMYARKHARHLQEEPVSHQAGSIGQTSK